MRWETASGIFLNTALISTEPGHDFRILLNTAQGVGLVVILLADQAAAGCDCKLLFLFFSMPPILAFTSSALSYIPKVSRGPHLPRNVLAQQSASQRGTITGGGTFSSPQAFGL
jgi:hypothetical protein